MTDQISTINPTTGEQIATYDLMTDAEWQSAVDACHEAFLSWKGRSLEDRAKVLKGIGQALRDNQDELAKLMTEEMGKVLSHSYQEIALCAAICDWTAENGPKELADEERPLMGGEKGIVTYSPIGVIYGIQPWNFPSYQVIRYSIANLMAGNGVLLKHAESVTGSGLLLEKIFREGGLPEGLFTVLRITHDQSDKIIAYDKVRGVTLTGSPGAGGIVAEQAGKALKKSVLELGSNDAYIVLEDADLDQAVEQCVMGRVYNNGETCVSAKRFIVVDALYDAFRERFVEKMKALKSGDPTAEDTDLGPMAREDLRDGLHQQVQDSVKNGAKATVGGEMPGGPGFFYPATVLEDVKPGQPAYDDELFGPVASLIRAKDADDAMRIANDSRFGLGGAIFSKDVEKATRLASEHFDTGMVFINGFGLAVPNMPFGGVKDSGYGREHGGFGMKEFVNAKAIQVKAA
ncbi:NAD-dependent succinate-semialdehyde dehydrogenase [Histidinibacterium aquaticum]|uniref:NAD-dependent succinate-semialdehyde dehydrogenase n=1 Tax=Histidinibacterium aquaticum TaxID=2613962 RepID=A0A5J5GJP1_9RHOB|nr:NAD-dependent succinate-semialdehyde dehydrogenase [Histidinibacterium aquaticum]KAA9007938.1 NAD-dependent succinate-semialdehyde dehydrogenase [Histidinibacterium aquaticum]